MSSPHFISHHLFVAAAGHGAREKQPPVASEPAPQAPDPVVMDLELLQADSRSRPGTPLQPWIRPASNTE
ncbi:MAG TPA: hypothetical protein VN673_01285 [Clostridia bacterium]|nr:hypothetical protein [Clostridia bacterium]